MWQTILLLFALALPTRAVPLDPAGSPFLPEILVRARVIEVTNRKQYAQRVTFVVESVYAGDAGLKGRRFVLDHDPKAAGLERPIFNTLFRKGEVGIWWLAQGPGPKQLTPRILHHTNGRLDPVALPVPARKVLDRFARFAYRDAVRWAEVVQEVAKAAPAKQITLLKKYSLSDNPHVASWSIHLLGRYRPGSLVPFLTALAADARLSISGQIAVDEVLCALDKRHWLTSKQRLRLLERWVSGEVDEESDHYLVEDRVRVALLRKELDWPTWLPLMVKLNDKNAVVDIACGRWIELTEGKDADSLKARQFIFEQFLQQAKGVKARDVAWLGRKFRYLYPLRPAELAAVRALGAKSDEEAVQALVKEIVEKSELRREQWEAVEKANKADKATHPPVKK